MASNTNSRPGATPHAALVNPPVDARAKRSVATKARRKEMEDEQQAASAAAQAGAPGADDSHSAVDDGSTSGSLSTAAGVATFQPDAIHLAAGAAPADASISLPTPSSPIGASTSAASTAATATAASGSFGGLGTIGLLTSAVALVAVAAGTGGSHDTAPIAKAPVAPAAVDASVDIKVLAGPLTAPVLVEVFDKDGNLVAGGLSDLTGAAHLLLPLDFSGPMLVKASATTADGIAYVDEATGQTVHYTGSLRAMVMFSNGGQATVTPLSELAVAKMGLTGDNANVDEATLTGINALVAKLFGVHSLTGPATTVLDAAFDESDGVTDAERFGQILAGLSGADSATGGLAETLARLAAAIDIVAGMMGDAGSSLLATGNAAFAAGPNAAKAASITAGFAAVPHIALAAGEDSYLNATEDGIRGVLHYSQMSAGDVIQLHTGEGSTASTLGAAHTVTASEAASGFISVTLTRADLPIEGSATISATHTDALGRSTVSNTVSIIADYTAPALALSYTDGTQLLDMGARDNSAALKVSSENLTAGDVLQILLAGSPVGARYVVQARDVSNGFAMLDVSKADLGVDGDKVLSVMATDAAGNAGTSNAVALALDTSVPDTPVVTDTTAPVVTHVSFVSGSDSGPPYGPGDVITVRAVFSEAVEVTGHPTMHLAIDTAGKLPADAVYVSGSGTDTLTFVYTVQGADHDENGVDIAAGSFNPGADPSITIKDLAGNDAVQTHAAVSGGATQIIHQPFVLDPPVDTTPPAALSMALESDTGLSASDGVSRFGTVDVSGIEAAAGTTWQFSVDGGNTWTTGSGSGTFELAEGSYAIGQVQVMQTDAAHNAGPVSSNAQAFVIDVTAPAAPAISFGSESSLEHPYAEGAAIVVKAEFDEAVYVGGQPMVHLVVDTVGGASSDAPFTSGSGSNVLRFTYHVQAGDLDSSGVDIAPGSLNPNADSAITIRDLAGNDADTMHASLVGGNLQTIGPDPVAVPPDTTPPDAPTVALAVDTGALPGDGVSNVGLVNVSGIEAAPGTFWYYSLDDGMSWSAGDDSHAFVLPEGHYSANQISVIQVDAAHNSSALGHNAAAFTIDTTAPLAAAPTFVTSAGDSPYQPGQTISTQAVFDEAVNVTGIPGLLLALDSNGSQGSFAHYAGGSGTNTLSFDYVVQAVDQDVDGVDILAGSFNPYSDPSIGISDMAGNAAIMTHAAAIGGGSQTVNPPTLPPPDTTPPQAPTITLQTDTGASAHDNLTNQGTMIVGGLEALSGTTWHYSFDYGNHYLEGSGSASFELPEGTYEVGQVKVYQSDAAHNNSEVTANLAAFTIDTTAPVVTNTSFYSSGPYFSNDNIGAQVSFNELVYVDGTPAIQFALDSDGGIALGSQYGGNSGGTLYFYYTVQPGDYDATGVDIVAGNLNPGAGPALSITDLAGNAADTSHSAVMGGAGDPGDQRVLMG